MQCILHNMLFFILNTAIITGITGVDVQLKSVLVYERQCDLRSVTAVPCQSAVKLFHHSERRTWFGNKNRGGHSRRQTWFYGRFHRWGCQSSAPGCSVPRPPSSSPGPYTFQIAGASSCREQNTAIQNTTRKHVISLNIVRQ